ncbi:hypothetical protein [Flavobacterium sp.]|uniref:hypothetical protein n=1 Tax=Flavobacterium sp. TaxID=239 RepID=UPI00375380BB
MKDFKLDTHPKITSGYAIPEHYFDTFSEKILLQLPKEEPRILSFYARNRTWIYSAAAVLVLALSIPVVYQLQNNQNEMTTSEVETYITQHTTVSDDDIVDLLDKEDIDKLKTDVPIENEVLEDVLSNNSEIEQYITN